MAFCTTTTPPPRTRLSSCSASEETLLPTRAFRSLRIPRLRPPFWPWEKVKMGSLTVSPMGFGTWAWGNQLLWGYERKMDGELQTVFNLAVENGINLFDTADSYGTGKLNGQSEKLLGKFIREFPGQGGVRDGVVIATKFAAYPWRLTSGQFVKACESSLERLEIDKIGIGQLHWSTANYAPLQEAALWDGLVAMYDKGLVQAVGVSNYGPKQLVKIHNYLKARGVPLSSAQVQFSLLSMGEKQMQIKDICDSLGIRVISYSPLGLGMLTGKYTASNLPRGPRALLFGQILPGLGSLLRSLKEIAERRGKTIPQFASCGSVPLESSYEKVPRCVYTSTLLYEYRGFSLNATMVNHRCLQWTLAYSERFSTDFYITDIKSGMSALVKAGCGSKVTPLIVENTLVNTTNRHNILSSCLKKWLAERNLSTEARLLHLKEGYIKEGSYVTVMGVLHRDDNNIMVLQPHQILSTGCHWRKLLLPVDFDGLILRVLGTSSSLTN